MDVFLEVFCFKTVMIFIMCFILWGRRTGTLLECLPVYLRHKQNKAGHLYSRHGQRFKNSCASVRSSIVFRLVIFLLVSTIVTGWASLFASLWAFLSLFFSICNVHNLSLCVDAAPATSPLAPRHGNTMPGNAVALCYVTESLVQADAHVPERLLIWGKPSLSSRSCHFLSGPAGKWMGDNFIKKKVNKATWVGLFEMTPSSG